jgi:hypothetical protein
LPLDEPARANAPHLPEGTVIDPRMILALAAGLLLLLSGLNSGRASQVERQADGGETTRDA